MKISKYYAAGALAFLVAGAGLISCLSGGKLQSITVTPSPATIAPGTTQQFTATARFSDGTTLNWTSAAFWETSSPDEVQIGNELGKYGLATSLTDTIAIVTEGTYTITATDTVNRISGIATLNVEHPDFISVTPTNPFMEKGTSHQFSALANFVSNGTDTVTQDLTSSPTVTWSTSDGAEISSINPGYVTAGTGTGQVVITAEYLISGISGSTTLTITDTALDSIEITQFDADTLKATGNYLEDQANPTRDFTSSVTWTSSDTSIVEVENGNIIKKGPADTVTITATDPITGTKSNELRVTVP